MSYLCYHVILIIFYVSNIMIYMYTDGITPNDLKNRKYLT